jgi:alpha-L-arabinofuranosidase
MILPVLLNGSTHNAQDNLYASAAFDNSSRDIILKVVNASNTTKNVRINLAGSSVLRPTGRAFVLKSSDLKAENSLDQPVKLSPTERQFEIPSGEFDFTLDPSSLTVLRIPSR